MSWKKLVLPVILILSFLALGSHGSDTAEGPDSPEEPKLSKHLEPLRDFVGKTWRGEFADSTPEKPKFNVSRWERALNGQAIRIVHSVNDGEYGGETFVVWDAAKEKVVYYYFTTAGFYTTGTFEFEDGKYVCFEKVTGEADGVTEVKEIGTILPDGRLHTKAFYLKGGEWVDGHEIMYASAPSAEIKFR